MTHELSTGQEAEAFVEVDDLGRGDALIYGDGVALMHVTTDEHAGVATPTALAGCVACGALAGIASAAADDIEKDYCG